MAAKAARSKNRQVRGDYAPVKAMVPVKTKRKLDQMARNERLSVSAIIARALDAYFAAPEPQGFEVPEGIETLEELRELQLLKKQLAALGKGK